MLSDKTKGRLRKATGIWLLLTGVAILAIGIFTTGGLILLGLATGNISMGYFFYLVLMLPGALLVSTGISVLNESSWGLAITVSIILCIALVVLFINEVYPIFSCVCLGISIMSTASLFFVKSEFS